GWLSRGDLATRGRDAGPDLYTPNAQCLGKHSFELSLIILPTNEDFLDSKIHKIAKEFNCPFLPITVGTANTPLRLQNKIVLSSRIIYQMFKNPYVRKETPYLPNSLSFLEIDNDKIQLSIFKKSEHDDFLIIRLYNVSSQPEQAILKFNGLISIDVVKIVNFLEEIPSSEIKAEARLLDKNNIEIQLDPHVIGTLKINPLK
ncbi:MAG: hypothetical protein EU544_06730, partial [Promethearchaeota archaeon]